MINLIFVFQETCKGKGKNCQKLNADPKQNEVVSKVAVSCLSQLVEVGSESPSAITRCEVLVNDCKPKHPDTGDNLSSIECESKTSNVCEI